LFHQRRDIDSEHFAQKSVLTIAVTAPYIEKFWYCEE